MACVRLTSTSTRVDWSTRFRNSSSGGLGNYSDDWLRETKALYDPGDLFKANHPIPPA